MQQLALSDTQRYEVTTDFMKTNVIHNGEANISRNQWFSIILSVTGQQVLALHKMFYNLDLRNCTFLKNSNPHSVSTQRFQTNFIFPLESKNPQNHFYFVFF